MTRDKNHSHIVSDGFERMLEAVYEEQKDKNKIDQSTLAKKQSGFIRKVWTLLNTKITIIPFEKKSSKNDHTNRSEKMKALKDKYDPLPTDALF